MKAEAPTCLKSPVTLAGLVAAALAASLAGLAFTSSPSQASVKTAKSRVHALTITIVGPARGGERLTPPSNFAVAPGVPVKVTVTNFTREFHTFTIPGLHVSRLILPARGQTPRKTTFTFTPAKGGSFAWFCAICRSGDHGHPHAMGGTIWAIIDPSVFSGG